MEDFTKKFSLAGKVAWVTGATYGLGFGYATAFAQAGAKVVFNDISQDKVDMGIKAYAELGIDAKVGPVVSSDRFYDDNENWKLWKKYGAIGIEMESAELFTLAAEFNRKALSIFTVSDHIVKGGQTSAEERQNTFKDMMILALETIIVE